MVLNGLEQLGLGLAETSATHECFLDARGDLSLTKDELENFANALWRRLMTPLAFFPEYPDYGSQLHELIGMGFVPEVLNLAEIFVTQCLMREPRVDKISSIVVVPTDYRALTFYASVKPIETPTVYVMTFDYFLER